MRERETEREGEIGREVQLGLVKNGLRDVSEGREPRLDRGGATRPAIVVLHDRRRKKSSGEGWSTMAWAQAEAALRQSTAAATSGIGRTKCRQARTLRTCVGAL